MNDIQFADRKIYELFVFIHAHHKKHVTDPTEWYEALREIIDDRTVVSGKQHLKDMMDKLPTLRQEYPNHTKFFDWFYETYTSYTPEHVEDNTDKVEDSNNNEEIDNNTLPPIITRENHTMLAEEEAQSVNIRDVKESIERVTAVNDTPTKKHKRRRWWLLFLA